MLHATPCDNNYNSDRKRNIGKYFGDTLLKPNLGGGGRGGRGRGNFTPCWFDFNNSETVKAVFLAFSSIQ